MIRIVSAFFLFVLFLRCVRSRDFKCMREIKALLVELVLDADAYARLVQTYTIQ